MNTSVWTIGTKVPEHHGPSAGYWLASPTLLKDRTWGAWLPNSEAKEGDGVVIQTRTGQEWAGTLIEQESPGSYKWKYEREFKRTYISYGGYGGDDRMDYLDELQMPVPLNPH